AMNRRPVGPSRMSSVTLTALLGRKAGGRGKATELVPPVAMAPLKWMIPPTLRTSALEVPNGALVHPFTSVSGANELADLANETPSSEAKHAALEKTLPSGSTVTTPPGEIAMRPLLAWHMSEGTKTAVVGRNAGGRMNGTGLVPVVAMAPLKWTIPPVLTTAALEVPNGALVQPFT